MLRGDKKIIVQEPVQVIDSDDLTIINGGSFQKKTFRSFFWTEQHYFSI